MDQQKIAPWQRSDNFSVQRHQQLVDAANRTSVVPGGDGTEVRGGAFGKSVAAPTSQAIPKGTVVKVKGTATSAQGGVYGGRVQRGDGSIDPTSGASLAEPNGQSDNGVDDAWIANPTENGATDWALTPPFYGVGLVTGYSPDGRLSVELATGSGGGSGLPPGTGKYKVLQLIDDLNPGTPDWDWVRFH